MNRKINLCIVLTLAFILGVFNVMLIAHPDELQFVEADEISQIMPRTEDSLNLMGTNISKSISNVSRSGDYIDVTVSLDSNPGVWSFMTDLVFDETALTPVSITEAGGLQDMQVVLPPVDGGRYFGRLVFVAYSFDISYEIGAIVTVRFRVNDSGNRALPVAIGYLDVTTDDGFGGVSAAYVFANNEILSQHGIQAFGEAAVAPFSTTPRPGGILIGDANNDGRITSADATRIAQYVTGQNLEDFNRRAADINVDGMIEPFDVTLLARWLAGHNVVAGPPQNSLTIIPHDNYGNPVYRAQIQVIVNGTARPIEQLHSGIISILNIPNGGNVRFYVTAESGSFSREIPSFNFNNHGVQVVHLSPPITVGNVSAFRGGLARVPIMLDMNPGLTSLRLMVRFDETKLRINCAGDVVNGTVLRDFMFPGLDPYYPVRSGFILLWFLGHSDSTGVLSNMFFTVLDNASSGDAYVRVYFLDASNSEYDQITFPPVSVGHVTVR
ncbi:MAG: dockerin type I domain-containing protein [Defluviitaleaceae bacterium]|nr:dockerin type I domain-containing protein [Defluviitaleaceae bacterium]